MDEFNLALEEKRKQRVFWGTLTLSVFLALLAAYVVAAAVQIPEKTPVLYAALAVFAGVILTALTGAALVLLRRASLGLTLDFYAVLALTLTVVSVFENRAIPASVVIIVVSVVSILWLFPLSSRKRMAGTSAAALVLLWLLEIFHPLPRQPIGVIPAGPLVAVVFALAVAGVLVAQARKAIQQSVRIKILSAFLGITFMATLAVGAGSYFSFRRQIRADMRQRLLNIISVAALQQDGDLFATLQKPEDKNTEAYRNMQAVNAAILSTDRDLAYIFSVRVDPQGKMTFVVGSSIEEGYEPIPIGEPYDDPSALLAQNALTLDHPIVDEDFYTDQYGTFLSAYAPIYAKDGTRVGIVGVDIYADKVLEQERSALLNIGGIALAVLLLAGLFSLYAGNLFTNPIVHLSATAREISSGNLTAVAKAETIDEIGDLASAFNAMTARLRELIGSLEQRVAERTAKMERRNRELALAAQVGQNVSQPRAIQSMLGDAVEMIRAFFDMYYVQVFLLDPETNELVLQFGTGEVGARLMAQGHRLPIDERSINGRAALAKQPVVISDTANSPDFLPNPLLPNVRAEISLPLLAGETLIGVMDFQSDQAGQLDEETLFAFEPMAAQIAIAIQNARLLQETTQARAEVEEQARQTRAALEQVEEQARQTQAALREAEKQARLTQKLSDAGLKLNRAADLQEVAQAALETLDIPEVNRAVLEIFHYNSENQIDSVDVAANWWGGWGRPPTAVGTRYSAEELPLVNLYLTSQPVFIEDAFDDERVDETTMQLVRRLNIHSVAILPLFTGARQIGVLLLETEEVYRFKEDEARLFAAMAPQISTALENRRQFERAQKQAERQAALNLISQKIQNAASVEAALQIAARELGRALDLPLTVAQLNMKEKP